MQNEHGDVVNLTDKDGKVTKSYRYDAFGVEKNIDEKDTNAFRYCGEYYDKETSTVYLRARYYNLQVLVGLSAVIHSPEEDLIRLA